MLSFGPRTSQRRSTKWSSGCICAVNGITLNPEKFHFAEDTVEFAGFSISPTGVRPGDKYLQSIMEFPTPTNITDIRSRFGLVNQVAYTFAKRSTIPPNHRRLGERVIIPTSLRQTCLMPPTRGSPA